MENLLIWLILGAVIGWIATSVMGDRSSLLINTLMGALVALVAGYVLTPVFRSDTIRQVRKISIPFYILMLLSFQAKTNESR